MNDNKRKKPAEVNLDLSDLTLNLNLNASEALESRLNLSLCNVMGGRLDEICTFDETHRGPHSFEGGERTNPGGGGPIRPGAGG